MNDSHGDDALGVDLRLSTTTTIDDTVIVAAAGEVDMVTVPQLHAAVFEVLNSDPVPGRLVLDLHDVTFLSSAGLGLMVEIAGTAEARNISLAVVAGTPVLVRPLEVTGLAERFALFDDLPAALAAR
ncbi:STAS domain-containing protein [Pseudonocardia sp. GCM10023141]|uniref:STAS domain-containing protein n=1 Tax=Pseudonocardia sp. GCM10023141 TaxID=3252653 RepID=UPI003623980C